MVAAASFAKSIEGHCATTMARTGCPASRGAPAAPSWPSRCTRKSAGSCWPVLAETISAPMSSQRSATRARSTSLARPPRCRKLQSNATISACNSRGMESCNFEPASPVPSGKAAMRWSSTRRPPTTTPAPLAPHSKFTCRVRSTHSASHSKSDRNSACPPLVLPTPEPAAIWPGTKPISEVPMAFNWTCRLCTWSRFCKIFALSSSALRCFACSRACSESPDSRPPSFATATAAI
mmetsp:Transcript_9281/g.32763  ORF Transcript_9281/g.32763 Transcript_9281/m.32763 type:complete len:236 (+) Transcript_9281:768-1475(+)